TYMYRDAAQAPDAVRAQLQANAARVARLTERLRQAPPRAVVTCARGSSDHAATFARYLIETRLGLLTSSAAPSVSSVYDARPDLSGALVLAISQSGASPDLLAFVSGARAAGAYIVALVNAENSPLAQLADELIPLGAGLERSVAATKSYIASLAAIVHLVANWTGDVQLASELAAQGADVLLAGGSAAGATILPTEVAHPVIEPLLHAQSFYRMANALSLARGRDPDRPPHLHKVTETL